MAEGGSAAGALAGRDEDIRLHPGGQDLPVAVAVEHLDRGVGDQGRPLGIRPNVLVVPPQLEEAAFHLLNTETQDGGGSNPWKGTAEIVVTPYLAG